MDSDFWAGALGIACFIAWLTHIFTCFSQAMWGFSRCWSLVLSHWDLARLLSLV
jgi:hypothetical protein